MKIGSLKRKVAILLVTAILATTGELPVNMNLVYAKESVSVVQDDAPNREVSGNATISKVAVTIKRNSSTYRTEMPYSAEEFKAPTKDNFSICGPNNKEIDTKNIELSYVWYNDKGDVLTYVPKDVGTYSVSVSVKENNTYKMSGPACTIIIKITPKELTPKLTGSVTKAYDGTNKVPNGHSLKVTLDGVVTGETVGADAEFAYKSATAGTNVTVVASDITLKGTGAKNYKVTKSTVEAQCGTITKAGVTIKPNSSYATKMVYNAKAFKSPTKDDITIYKDNKKIDSQNVELSCVWYDKNGKKLNVAPKDAGNYYVLVSIKNSTTYEMSGPACKIEIEIQKQKLTPKLTGSVTKYYDKTPNVPKNHKLKVELDGVIAGETVGANAEFAYKSATAGNSVWVKASKITLTGSYAKNYELETRVAEKKCGKIEKADSVISAKDEKKLKNLKAVCGMKLSDIKLPEGFTWKTKDKKLICTGKTIKATVSYVYKDDSKNYKKVERTVTISMEHNLKKVKKKAATQKAAGNIAYSYCKGCDKYFDSKNKVVSEKETIVPYFPKSVELTVGKTISLNKIMLNGTKAYESMTVPSKYAKYISVDSKKKTIKAKAIKTKDYKNLPKEVTVNVKYAGGKKAVKIKLNIPAPKITIKREYIVIGGVEGYRYTINYNVKDASKVEVKVVSGVNGATLRNTMNEWISQRILGNQGTISFTIRKTNIKEKIKFQIVAQYGNRQSQPQIVTR